MKVRNILYIESNVDGTVGGSHHSLFLLVTHLDRSKYIPVVLFYQENSMVSEFRGVCDVHIFRQSEVFTIEKSLPNLFEFIKDRKIVKIPFKAYQKMHNVAMVHIPNLISIIRFLYKFKVDLIHVNNYPSVTDWLFVSKLFGIRIVSHLRGFFPISRTKKMLIKYYDRIISTSEWVTDQLKEQNIASRNVVLIHNGIDVNAIRTSKVSRKDFFHEWNWKEDSPVIGVIGNIRKWKGQHVAIEAIRLLVDRYNNIRCVLVGSVSNSKEDRDYFNYLNELVSRYNISGNIKFLGFRKDIYDIVNNLDVLVHTSIMPEPFGRVILEGMILRKPVIATNQGGPLEIIEDGVSGILVPPDDAKMLSDKISFLLDNKKICYSMGENARTRIEKKFGIDRNVRRIEELYSDLLRR